MDNMKLFCHGFLKISKPREINQPVDLPPEVRILLAKNVNLFYDGSVHITNLTFIIYNAYCKVYAYMVDFRTYYVM